MKKVLLSVFLLTLFQCHAFAALPPLWQGVQELKVILADKRLGNYLDAGDVITAIKKNEKGWIIITNKKRVTAEVSYESSSKPGPVQFSVKFKEA
jgi:hypothetical protein